MNFVSESELAEKKKIRQEEWEKVRKNEDPVEAPEEEYDPRSLYDRLKEQKDKKQFEFEEQLKFKNHFRGIDESEADFLLTVAKNANEIEKKKRLEEEEEISKIRLMTTKKIEDVSEKDKKIKILPEVFEKKSKSQFQFNLLKNTIKRKSSSESNVLKKIKKPDTKPNTVLRLVDYGSESSSDEEV